VEQLSRAVVRTVHAGFSIALLAISRLFYKLEIHGVEYLRTCGPLIISCRHYSGLDVIFLAAIQRNHGLPLGVTGFVTVNRFRAWWGKHIELTPLFWEQGLSAASLIKLHKRLQQGGSVFIADNEIVWDGRLPEPRSGVAWCALHTHSPVVVGVVTGGYRVAPRWAKRIPLRGKLVLRIGKPFYLSDAPCTRVTADMLQQANQRFLDELRALSDPGLIREEHPRCKGIPTLLWQCPVCRKNEALRHRDAWGKPAVIECRNCATVWVVERYQDDDYHLKVVEGDPKVLGEEHPLAEWYAKMKSELRLVPQPDPAVDLATGEDLYLSSQEATLEIEEDSPLWHRADTTEAPWEKESSGSQPFMKRWDRGRLFLTSQRFVWVGKRGRLSFQLSRLNSAHTQTILFFGFLYGVRRYRVRFRQDSLLKWLTCTALVGQQTEEARGHAISTSNY
jgi:1-acyl-sn-glycerol-3-phosphate acyltransferase